MNSRFRQTVPGPSIYLRGAADSLCSYNPPSHNGVECGSGSQGRIVDGRTSSPRALYIVSEREYLLNWASRLGLSSVAYLLTTCSLVCSAAAIWVVLYCLMAAVSAVWAYPVVALFGTPITFSFAIAGWLLFRTGTAMARAAASAETGNTALQLLNQLPPSQVLARASAHTPVASDRDLLRTCAAASAYTDLARLAAPPGATDHSPSL
ncbi:MAG TPA: hypothetical protein VGS41_08490 [Chthonomonadales bacterium]|nr:hypothetical protein [Chthonomonadales bacterium]